METLTGTYYMKPEVHKTMDMFSKVQTSHFLTNANCSEEEPTSE